MNAACPAKIMDGGPGVEAIFAKVILSRQQAKGA
jgi:hypothetical protein